MMRLLASGLLVACLALGACGGDDDSEQSAPSGKPLLGVTIGALLEEHAPLESEVETMADSGVTTVRAPFYWSIAQPEQGKPPSFDTTDPLVEATAKENIAVLPIVVGTPSWAARHPGKGNSPPAGTQTYADFMRALIAHYGPDGTFWKDHPDVPKRPLRDWQLWNEPDHLHYWSDQPYARDYVALVRAARRAIKDADPGARVVAAGFADRSWESIARVYRAGGAGLFDVVAIHPYTYEVRNVLRIVRYARRALDDAGEPNRPLWLTEVTWSSGRRAGHTPRPFETTPADQAARLSEALPLLLRTRRELKVERIYWENWISTDSNYSNPFDFSGLRVLHPDGSVTEKPAFAAFKRVALSVESP